MGIPGMYRWLIDRYPKTLCSVVEDPYFVKAWHRIDSSNPNPNGVEFDNLYIDMNGIIHPCFHQEGLPAPESYDEVFKCIFMYIEKVFNIVRPRKLLFLGVDGVAPRAKMNHQRIRRFRAAEEVARGVSSVRSGKSKAKKLDSNVITPGTEFMDLLSNALRYFVEWKMNKDRGWKGIKVILSDSTVVGEGEDKIMSYIRSQRNLPGYDPNTRHCLHGLDADLILLSLATHEIHISILREIITYGRKKFHSMKIHSKRKPSYFSCMRQFLHKQNFEFFNIWVLREYLERELLPDVEGTDIDRLIDDFVFICFFVGNDFLPCLPSFDISKGDIEVLLAVYRQEFVKMGYLTNAPEVNLKSMEHFLKSLSSHESSKRNQLSVAKHMRKRSGFQNSVIIRKKLTKQDHYTKNFDCESHDVDRVKRDDVMIQKKLSKQDHYTKNFDCESHDVDRIKRDAVLKYTEGVCWIMHYYYQHLCSWQWFYPYHYAPFASDFCDLDKLDINFTLGQPFKPLDQLLGVLPAASAQALPMFYRELMIKPSSPILDFYPKDFKVDRNGKKHIWQGVCKLPFIDESRLLSETVKVEHTLTDEEKQRNRFGRDRLFVYANHPLAEVIEKNPLHDPTSELQIQIKPELSGGMNGYLCICDNPICLCKIPSFVCLCKVPSFVARKWKLMTNKVRSVYYKCPSHAHIPKLPHGVIMPPRILRCQDRPIPPSLSPSIVSERNSQEDMKEDVELGMATKQDGSKDEVSTSHEATDRKQNNIMHDKSEAELHLVEGSQGMIVKKSTNQMEHDLVIAKHEEITTGNAIIIKDTQREKQQVNGNNRTKSGTDESLADSEKPLTREHESSLSLGGEPKRKLKKKRVRGDKLDAQVPLVEVSGGAGQNMVGENEATGEILQQQGTKKINKSTFSVEQVPTKETGSSNNQQEPVAVVRKEHAKRSRVVKGEEHKKMNGGGSGEKSIECDEPPTKNEMGHDAITGGQVHLVKGSINGKTTNKMESNGRAPPFANSVSQKVKVEIGDNLNSKMDYELVPQEIDEHKKRKEEQKRKRRKHTGGGEAEISKVDENMNAFEVREKQQQKLESDTKEPPFTDNVSQKVNVEIGENLNSKMDCELVPQEIDEHNKRKEEKKRKRRKHMGGGEAEISKVDDNGNMFEVREKQKQNLESATKEPPFADGVSQKVNVETGENLNTKLGCELIPQEIDEHSKRNEEKKRKRRKHTAGGEAETSGVENVNVFEVGEKQKQKLESATKEPPFADGVSQKVNVETGENLNTKLDCELIPQEINEHSKRNEEKKRKRRKHTAGGEAETSGVDENVNVFEVVEKQKQKLESATKEPPFADGVSQKVNVEIGENLKIKLDCELIPQARNKRKEQKKWKRRRHTGVGEAEKIGIWSLRLRSRSEKHSEALQQHEC